MPITRISGGGGTLDYNSLNNKPDFTVYNKINGIYNSVSIKTSNYVVTLTDGTILCNSSNNISITLPSAISAFNSTLNAGLILNIKNINVGVVTVVGTVDGMINPTINNQYDSVTIQSNGTTWNLI